MKDRSAGLLAAAFIGIVPGYISRSVAGSYDNEAIAIFLLMFTFYCWIKALKLGSALFGTLTALFYFYMVAAWGASAFFVSLCFLLTVHRWLCLHHKHDSFTRLGAHPYGTILQPSLRRLLVLVRHWHTFEYASPLRRIPACQH